MLKGNEIFASIYQKNTRHDVGGELGMRRVGTPVDGSQVVPEAGLQQAHQAFRVLLNRSTRGS